MGDGISRVATDRIELLLDQRPRTVQSIRIETSPDLVTWTAMKTIPNKSSTTGGFGVGRNGQPFSGNSHRGKVFYRFDPAAFTVTYPFFLRYVDIVAGVDDAISDVYAAFDPTGANRHVVTIEGTAPNEAVIADSLVMVLPPNSELKISVLSGADLLVGTSATGPEITVTTTTPLETDYPMQKVWLRGDGGTSVFQIVLWAHN